MESADLAKQSEQMRHTNTASGPEQNGPHPSAKPMKKKSYVWLHENECLLRIGRRHVGTVGRHSWTTFLEFEWWRPAPPSNTT